MTATEERARRMAIDALVALLNEPEPAPPRTWQDCEKEREFRAKHMLPNVRHSVDSSAIRSMLWRNVSDMRRPGKLTGGMIVEWCSGGEYMLLGVHKSLADAWFSSESKGKFWHKWIKGHFTSYRWEEGKCLYPGELGGRGQWVKVGERGA